MRKNWGESCPSRKTITKIQQRVKQSENFKDQNKNKKFDIWIKT